MIIFDIDTQHDFMDADGALYVKGAEEIRGNIERLLRAAGERGILTISSRCAHEPGDAEFAVFPPHCLEGTRGAERIFPDLPHLPLIEIEVEAPAVSGALLVPATHYVVKKKVYDLFSNAWLEGLRQDGAFGGEECVVFGVATDYCVRGAGLGLAAGGAKVRLVTDAIRGVAPESTQTTLDEMVAAGVEFTTTDEVLKVVAQFAKETTSTND
jgi:nicotinamidase/pyrazinamidase